MYILPQDMKQLLDLYENKKRTQKEFINGCVIAIVLIAIYSF